MEDRIPGFTSYSEPDRDDRLFRRYIGERLSGIYNILSSLRGALDPGSMEFLTMSINVIIRIGEVTSLDRKVEDLDREGVIKIDNKILKILNRIDALVKSLYTQPSYPIAREYMHMIYTLLTHLYRLMREREGLIRASV